MTTDTFAGDKKAPMRSPLAAVERKFINHYVGRFPRWIETYHLTLLTVPWSLGVLVSGYLCQYSMHWLWLSSVMIFLQWFTDSFDGSLGKYRHTGLVKWGYYMDHLLDYVFVGALLVSYTFVLAEPARTVMILLIPVIVGFWVNAFLNFSVTNEFKITYFGFGPTEIRLLFIFVNTAIVFFGTGWFAAVLPVVLFLSILILCFIVYRTHKQVWAIDMAAKRQH